MGTLQTAYDDNILGGFPGQVANSENLNVISRTVRSATLAFGALALRGATQHECISATAETLEAAAPVAQAGNTGNGTFLATPTISAGAKLGTYLVEIENAATNAGGFTVEDPDGNEVGAGTVGVAFSAGGVAFTLQDGATDFVRGDGFTFAVQATSGTNVGNVLGIARTDTTIGAEVANYRENDTAAIVTQGQVWVTAGGAVNDGDPVYFVVSTGRYLNAAGAGRIRVPKTVFDDDATTAGDMVRVSIRNRLDDAA